MKETSKNHSIFRVFTLTVVAATFGASISSHSQALNAPSGPAETTLIKSIRFGGHPDFTRVLIDLDKIAPYRVKPDFSNKRVTLTMVNARLSPDVRSRLYNDNSLKRIDVSTVENTVRIQLGFKNRNIRFFHAADPVKSQIILDFKSGSNQLSLAKKETIKATEKKASKNAPSANSKPSAQARKVLQSMEESKDRNGWEDYQKALKAYQSQDYPLAIKAFKQFGKTYPESKFLGQIAFLTAEAEYNIAFSEAIPDYEKALDAYKFAMRQYPAILW